MNYDEQNYSDDEAENNDYDFDSTDDEFDDAPPEFICPITLSIMKDPVIMPDGQTYERKAIQRALRVNPISPITREPMHSYQATTNYALKNLIEKYINDKHQNKQKDDKNNEANENLDKLLSLGFDRKSSEKALKQSYNNIKQSLVILVNKENNNSNERYNDDDENYNNYDDNNNSYDDNENNNEYDDNENNNNYDDNENNNEYDYNENYNNNNNDIERHNRYYDDYVSEMIGQLIYLGVSEETCYEALQNSNYQLEEAVDYIIDKIVSQQANEEENDHLINNNEEYSHNKRKKYSLYILLSVLVIIFLISFCFLLYILFFYSEEDEINPIQTKPHYLIKNVSGYFKVIKECFIEKFIKFYSKIQEWIAYFYQIVKKCFIYSYLTIKSFLSFLYQNIIEKVTRLYSYIRNWIICNYNNIIEKAPINESKCKYQFLIEYIPRLYSDMKIRLIYYFDRFSKAFKKKISFCISILADFFASMQPLIYQQAILFIFIIINSILIIMVFNIRYL